MIPHPAARFKPSTAWSLPIFGCLAEHLKDLGKQLNKTPEFAAYAIAAATLWNTVMTG